MEKEKIADALNKLIEINNDRVEGYERAEKETDDNGLKTLFTRFAAQSRSNKSELEGLVRSHGEEPAQGTTTSGKFYRAWMDIKSALTGKDRKAIVASCEYGEDVAKETYQDVIKDLDGASSTVQAILMRQHSEIKEAHDQVKALRDTITK
jgi:uncharacterized protein (TIGR02284 family)